MRFIVKQLSPVDRNIDIRELGLEKHVRTSLAVFDSIVIAFLNDFSRKIMLDKSVNKIPAITALAFWLRKASLEELIAENKHISNSSLYRANPVGTVFHVCPSNVDVMFMYSLTIAVLTGNRNVVRVSKRAFHPNIMTLFSLMNQILQNDEYATLRDYIYIVSYEHEEEINQYLSGSCNARIIWGGDNTINLFKSFKTAARTKDIVFADRFSYAILNTDNYVKIDDKERYTLAYNFFNDSYTFDQKGCSSPQLLFLCGSEANVNFFLEDFGRLVSRLAEDTYITDIFSLASLKLNTLVADIMEDKTKRVLYSNNYTTFVDWTDTTLNRHSCGGGYFYYKHIKSLNEIEASIDRKAQTLSYYGFNQDEVEQMASITYNKGLDRVVPIGEALKFSYVWDGYNLLDELLTKKLIVKK